ncbi:dephospho-CoA kinase [Porphyromonas miyakawae]|uniref:Dephospho-CoA kinase n=1 Tax=Porphyromonas miyakawae TaxID=3137470 RepID=A0ABQ0E2P2_9PORP
MGNMPFTLGITGGIGSGKSLISQLLRLLYGIPVYDCDTAAKSLYDTDAELRADLIGLLGKALYATPQGTLNRPLLADIIFNNKEKLTSVESLVHPRVLKDFIKWRAESAAQVVAVESAILLKSVVADSCDTVLFVEADKAERLLLTKQRDHATDQQVAGRMAQQQDQLHYTSTKVPVIPIFNGMNKPILPQLELLIPYLTGKGLLK